MLGFKALGHIANTSFRSGKYLAPQLVQQHNSKQMFSEVQSMVSKSIMVPNSLFIMNMRQLLLKTRTQSENSLDGMESLLNGTSLSEILDHRSMLLLSPTYFIILGTKAGVTLSDRRAQ